MVSPSTAARTVRRWSTSAVAVAVAAGAEDADVVGAAAVLAGPFAAHPTVSSATQRSVEGRARRMAVELQGRAGNGGNRQEQKGVTTSHAPGSWPVHVERFRSL
ncbi:hypothetical protein GCM10010282_30550 [Streptomyces roseolus]|nr:hypothetical protein GCM10010282_30550 [Streptomyces roseolus]